MNLYEKLGLNKNATDEEIKKAFRDKAKEHHPDKGGDPEKFREISVAYDVLSDKNKKSRYDSGEPLGSINNNSQDMLSGFIAGLFFQVTESTDTEKEDVFKLMVKNLQKALQALRANLFANLEKVKKYEKIIKRIKKDKSNSFFKSLVTYKIAAINSENELIKKDMKLHEKALEFMSDCEYSPEKREEVKKILFNVKPAKKAEEKKD